MIETRSGTAADSGIVALAMLLRFHGIAADVDQIRHQVGNGPFGTPEMLRHARSTGVKAREVTTNWLRLEKAPLPAIALLRDGGHLILAKVGADKILVQSPLSERPELITRADLEAVWTGQLILVSRRAGLVNLARRFDLSWLDRKSVV